MREKSLFVIVLLALAVASSSAGTATAGALKGFVLDLGKSPPGNGLSGARVQLQPLSGKPTDPVITDTDGEYQLVDVGKGEYRLVVIMAGYIPRPHDRVEILMDGDVQADDVLLIQEYGTEAYYAVVAAGIVGKVASAPKDGKMKVLNVEWDNLRVINLPPSSKAILARELNKLDASAKQVVPELRSYLAARPEDILKAQLRFGQALAGTASLPGKDALAEMNLNHEIVADLVQFELRASQEPTEKQNAFRNEFLIKWKDTPAWKRFGDLQKLTLDRPQ
jgi:hypothetical protein